MSGSVGHNAEPNLTPILDMVFQLITFFMLVINFKAAELDTSLMLPVIGSAKPLPEGAKIKLVVLNVQIATKCPYPGCDSYATLQHEVDENGKMVYKLHCERGHDTPYPQGAITNGKTALSLYGRIFTKTPGDRDHPSIPQYLASEAELSLMAAKLTREDIQAGKGELDDTIVIRADATCPFGAVNYIITECQKQGYRKFALKTGAPPGT